MMKCLTLKALSLVPWVAAAGLMLYGAAAPAAPIVLCTEDPVTGCTNPFVPGFTPAESNVASDGEIAFRPFNITVDVSDAIQFLNNVWVPDTPGKGPFGAGFWTQLVGTNTWYLPASLPGCTPENEPNCVEPVGVWDKPGFTWAAAALGTYVILESDGKTVSDVLVASNTGPGGTAQLSFASDPLPEPASLALLATGLLGFGVIRRRRKGM